MGAVFLSDETVSISQSAAQTLVVVSLVKGDTSRRIPIPTSLIWEMEAADQVDQRRARLGGKMAEFSGNVGFIRICGMKTRRETRPLPWGG